MLQNLPHSDRAPPPSLLRLACARVARPSAPAPNTYRSPRPAIRKRIRPTVRPPRATAHRTFAKGGADARTPPLFAIWRSASGTCRGGGGAFTWVANGARHSRCARGRGWRAPRAAGGLFLLGRVFLRFFDRQKIRGAPSRGAGAQWAGCTCESRCLGFDTCLARAPMGVQRARKGKEVGRRRRAV